MFIRLIMGETRLTFKKRDLRRVLDVFRKEDIQFRNLTVNDESFSAEIPLYRKRSFFSILKKEGIEISEGKSRGLVPLCLRYRKRPGILIGLIICVLMICLSGRIIWCVNVTGNRNVSDREIVELLDSLGCGVGDTYKDIDFDILHNKFLMECPDIAWIAVNMNGTHANVEVRETVYGKEKEEGGFYNIVASEGGQIEMIAATEGKPVVEINDTVLEGELLVSGAISYKADTMNRFESAEGKVFARVNRSFEINVPYEEERKVYTGEKTEKKQYRIFDFNINLSSNSRISYEICDTITLYNQIHLFDSVPLPLYIEKTVYSEYVTERAVLKKDEAMDRAMALYRERLKEELSDDSLISKKVVKIENKDGVTIKCDLYCLADIAKKVPLELSGNEKTENKN